MLQRATRPGCVAAGTAVADDSMAVVDDHELHASSSSEPMPDVTTAPVLKSWSSVEELQARLRELGAPIHGTKNVLSRRLCEWEQNADRRRRNIWRTGGKSWHRRPSW